MKKQMLENVNGGIKGYSRVHILVMIISLKDFLKQYINLPSQTECLAPSLVTMAFPLNIV